MFFKTSEAEIHRPYLKRKTPRKALQEVNLIFKLSEKKKKNGENHQASKAKNR